MSLVEIRDYALWAKHVHSNNSLKEKIIALPAGELIELEVDGLRGMWKKMDDGSDGRPTPGLKALGIAKTRWHEMQSRRGELVSISEVQ